MVSAASDEMDDFDDIAVAQRGGRVLGTRHDGTVHLDGDSPWPEREGRDQVGDGRAVGERSRLVVHRHPHRWDDIARIRG